MGVIARQSIKGALANYLGVAIGFVITFFVLTRYLTEEEVGLTRVMVDAAMLFSCLAQVGTNASIVRFFPHFKSREGLTLHHGFFGLAMLLPLAGFALVGGALLVFHDPLVAAYSVKSPLVADYFYLLPMLTFFALYTTVFETGASVLMRITVPKMVREVGIRVFNLAAYLLYGYGLVSLDGFVWLFCGSYALAMLLNFFYLIKIARAERPGVPLFKVDWSFLTRERVSEIGRYTLFMTATVLAGNIPLVNSLFLGVKAGAALTGVYAIASYVANVVEVPYRSLGAISRPVVATAVKEGDWAEVNRLGQQVSLHQLLVSLTILFVIWINLDTLYAFIPNGASYAGGAGVVLVLGLAKVVNSSFSVGTDVLNYSRHYAKALLFIALLTASALGLNAWLIGLWGIDGSAAATLFSYFLYFGCLLTFLHCKLGVSLFSAGQLKTLALMAVVVVLGLVWKAFVTPMLAGAGSTVGLLANALLKTAVLTTLLLGGAYAWRVSPTLNGMLSLRLNGLKSKTNNSKI